MKPTIEQLTEMLQLQDRLNATMGDPKWLFSNYRWGRAIRIECAELTEHLGWKWWKKQEPNWAQAKLECVDIWHFMLSSALVSTAGQHRHAAREILTNLDYPRMEVMNLMGKQITLGSLSLHDAVDVLSFFASVEYTFPAVFEIVMEGVGLSWAELRRQYVGKNVLNLFRQAHGDKEGTYRKVWHGREDNEWLAEILEVDPEITADVLRNRLWDIYSAVPHTTIQQPLPVEG